MKTDNNKNAFAAKVAIRTWAVGRISTPRVLDAFSGPQKMRSAAYSELPYVGIDKRKLGPDQYVGDNLRVLRAIDLAPYNVFDLDSWGEPWDALRIVTKRRKLQPGEEVAVMLTVGCMKMKFGRLSNTMASLVGSVDWATGWDGARLAVDIAESRLIRTMGDIQARRRVERPSHVGMIYDALIVRGRTPPPM